MKKNNYTPPQFFLRFFRWYCHPKLQKYIEGDLMELYNERVNQDGKRKADTKFIMDVLLLFRPGIIRSFGLKHLNNHYMFRNYIRVGWRSLLRSKGYSAINITGLAAGMGVTMLIGMWLYDEITFNRCHTSYERIAQVYQHRTFSGEINTTAETPIPLGMELRTAYKNDFKHVVRSWWIGSHILSIDDTRSTKQGTFMDAEALDMLSFTMLKGDRRSLGEPASIVLSESAAIAFFGDDDPINKMLRIDNLADVKVTGVFKEFPANSQFHGLQFVSTWDLWVFANDWLKAEEDNWNSGINVFVELHPNTSFETLSSRIRNLKSERISREQAEQENPVLFLQPMSRWHLYTRWKDGLESGGRIQYVWLFGIIGVFVLLLACINFMNLSTAQSERRSREVGIRKSIGSVRGQLINQFLTESFLVVLFSFVLALALVVAFVPWFNDLADKKMDVPWNIPYFWLISLAFILLTSFIAGSYPALYLSSFNPLKALKGSFSPDRSASIPRKVLVVVQFTVSIVLIIGTIVVWKQIQFAKNRPIGYTKEGLVMIRKTGPEFWGKFDALRNELKASGAVVEIAESSSPVTESWFNNSTGFSWQGKDPNRRDDFATVAVTHEYGKTMGWNFALGRDYSREFSTDSSAVILNEAAVRYMGLTDPIDEEITWNGKKFKVIGVIKDVIMDSPYASAKQTVFWLNYEGNVWINIRMNPAMSSSDALSNIETVFQQLIPSVPFDFKFTEDEFAHKFAAEERVGKLSNFFAILAILISCLGLFGMASFVAERRRKEVGVRKIMGASALQLWKMLSTEFVVLVGIAFSIGIPIAVYFLNQWLTKYEYRTELSVWVILITVAGTVAITLLTVSFQTIRAALVNPVNSLRSE